MIRKPIYVTKPSLAPLEEFTALLEGVWDSGILTHNGPLVQRFEHELKQQLGLEHFVAVTNGTVAIQMAIKALGLQGEIITTAFSWIATVSAINWEHCTPVFCDIDPATLNIDASRIEALITDKTVAIMPVHVFGNPCDVKAIEAVAQKHRLPVIYDAAHAVGTTWQGESVLQYGDISAISLHGTKLLNTAEGGGCITTNTALHEKLQRIRFFGHDDQKEIVEDGFNGKMTEVHAALGIANLKYFPDVLTIRKEKYHRYLSRLADNERIRFQHLSDEGCNFSYLPIIFDSEALLLRIEASLNRENIFPRRYFYPSLTTMDKVITPQSAAIAEDISRRILCLPLYSALDNTDIDAICDIINEELGS